MNLQEAIGKISVLEAQLCRIEAKIDTLLAQKDQNTRASDIIKELKG